MLMGFSTSAFQYEEPTPNSDWYAWITDYTNLFLHRVSGDLPGRNKYLSAYQKIHELAVKVNANAWRLSFSWERIFPERGKASKNAVALYKAVLKDLKDRGFAVFACLNHFVLPLWLHDPIRARETLLREGPLGWYSEGTVEEFLNFAKFAFENFSEYVDYWCTFNEPNNLVDFGYLTGYFPPGITSQLSTRRVRENVIRAHNATYDLLSKQGAKVGVVYNFPAVEGEKAQEVEKAMIWEFMERVNVDWVGVNYYSRIKVDGRGIPLEGYGFLCGSRSSLDGNPCSDYGWEVYPRGIRRAVELAGKLGKPVFVTENGVADERDVLRPKFILDHLEELKKSKVKVEGYLHWSLMDNFEWNFGYKMKFGIYDVEMNPKPSASTFKEATQLFT